MSASLTRPLIFFLVLVGVLIPAFGGRACAEWTKDITCPTGTAYRDVREYAGRQEFCERLLPGSLRVKQGPARFWLDPDFPNSRGNYTNGRQTGSWRECDKNGHCRHVDYPLIYPEEEHPGLKPEIPISFHNGRYVFDFGSCWSTWVTQGGTEDIDFNISDSMHRCVVAYFPRHVMEQGGEGTVICWVPFSVGRRKLRSLDLMHELPRLGLPQFCRPQATKAADLMIVDKNFRDFAYGLDVQCAAIEEDGTGGESFVFRFNSYVTDLVNELARTDGPLITRLCMSIPGLTPIDQPTEILHEPGGGTLLRYHFSNDASQARKQKLCVKKSFALKTSCR